MKFYEGNKFLTYSGVFSGLYTSNIEYFLKRPNWAKYFKIFMVFPYILCPVYFGSAIKNLFFDKGHILAKTYDITAIAGVSLVNFKLFDYYFRRERFEKIMKLWDESFKEDLFPKQRKEMLIQANKETMPYIKFLIISTVGSGLIYGGAPFFFTDKDLGHPSGLLAQNKSPDYELVVAFEMVTQALGLWSLLTYDSILLIFMSLESTQLMHLKKSLAGIIGFLKIEKSGQLLGPPQNEKSGDEVVKIVEEKLKIWVKLHQELIIIHEELRKAYHIPLCVQFTNLMVLVCLILFLNLTGGFTVKETVMSVCFIIGSYTIFYKSCNYGDSISINNDTIFEDAFTEAWYVYPKPIQKMFHIIILRSHRPLNLMAFNLYPLGAKSFSIVFRTAYALFSFLMQIMYKKSFRPN